jgi:F-type H+-transporting ATPase subunit delta
LLDVARREADPRGIENELASFAALLDGNASLKHVLTSPAIPAPKKTALMKDLVERGRVSLVVGKLLVLLAERDRVGLLPELLDEYRRRLLDFLNVVRADVVTAVPLPGERVEALERTLAEMTGCTVSMTSRVDPGIIGGVVTRIGSVVYDGSVKRQLEKMRETITAESRG